LCPECLFEYVVEELAGCAHVLDDRDEQSTHRAPTDDSVQLSGTIATAAADGAEVDGFGAYTRRSSPRWPSRLAVVVRDGRPPLETGRRRPAVT
jgi:hypothetical protein